MKVRQAERETRRIRMKYECIEKNKVCIYTKTNTPIQDTHIYTDTHMFIHSYRKTQKHILHNTKVNNHKQKKNKIKG